MSQPELGVGEGPEGGGEDEICNFWTCKVFKGFYKLPGWHLSNLAALAQEAHQVAYINQHTAKLSADAAYNFSVSKEKVENVKFLYYTKATSFQREHIKCQQWQFTLLFQNGQFSFSIKSDDHMKLD